MGGNNDNGDTAHLVIDQSLPVGNSDATFLIAIIYGKTNSRLRVVTSAKRVCPHWHPYHLALNRRREAGWLRLDHFSLVMPSDIGNCWLACKYDMKIGQQTHQTVLTGRTEPLQPIK